MRDRTGVRSVRVLSLAHFPRGISSLHIHVGSVLVLPFFHVAGAAASSSARDPRGNQPLYDVTDDGTGGLQTLLFACAFVTLLATAFFVYRLLGSSRPDGPKDEGAAATRGGTAQDRGGSSSQQLTTARRRRRDRTSLEALMATSATAPQTREDEATGGPPQSPPSEETSAPLRAAQRKREEREARRAERREERRQQGVEAEERTGAQESDEEDSLSRRTAAQKTKASSYELRQLAKEKERLRREEEELRLAEEKKKKEEEEYNKWKAMFAVEESGEMVLSDEEQQRELDRFIKFLEGHKVTELEDLAARFGLSTKDAVQRIRSLEDTGRLSGILDDRGKYVCVTEQELEALADYLRSKGRIHKEKDLVPACNRIIRLQPDEEAKKRLDEEERQAMSLICLNEDTEDGTK